MSALAPADWIHLPYFLEAARCGSFTAAARRLNSSQPTVGRHVEALEARLGTALFRRVAHGVVLTPAGTQVLGVAEEIERLVRLARSRGAAELGLSGTIRLWTSDGVGGYWLTPRLAGFQHAYPGIALEMLCSHDVPDVSRLEADVVVTHHEPTHPDVVPIASARMVFKPTAAHSYLRAAGTPRTLADLTHHAICDHLHYPRGGAWAAWADLVAGHRSVVLRTNSSLTLGMVTLLGHGVSMQPTTIARRESTLTVLDLDGYSAPVSFWLVCHRETKDIPRMRALIDFLRSALFRQGGLLDLDAAVPGDTPLRDFIAE
ncbi:LysR family transcriptional regulator [Azospirillum sp.]|uniref:LysR family transcriptional regulator n=1 Tax=Azospirillum sp. TaxID=34012 RepID=UPI002D2D0460|nr:LysR family transcriptional regulator [Azospirillum sp.]HYD70729.1 LysR family transcriptional regulator [Azospirillum sp.]